MHASVPWPAYLHRRTDDERSPVEMTLHDLASCTHSILSCHAGSQAVTALTLVATRRVRALRRPPVLLVCALCVLVARTPLQRAADRVACCLPDRGLGALDRCVDTPVASPSRAAPFRLPAKCVHLRGGAALAQSLQHATDFSPCAFESDGPQYLAPCLDDKHDASELGPPCDVPRPRLINPQDPASPAHYMISFNTSYRTPTHMLCWSELNG